VTSTIYLDTVKKVARASITGTAQPSVPAKLLAHLKLIIKFFGADGVLAVDADTPTCVIKPKLAPTGAPSLIDTTAVRTGAGATSQYVFEWASADSTALRAVMDATGDPTQPVELRCEIEYELDGNLERIAFPIHFDTSYTRPEDPAPEANTDSSWEWLKLRAPVANGFSHDDVERELTVAGGAGSGDVVGPASSVDSRPALFNGTTGKLLKQGTAALGDAAYKNTGSTAGTLAAGDDARMTNARTPTAHASTHLTGGADAIQEATAAQPGLATAAQITKLDGIEALADVTDAGNVGTAIFAADAVTTLADADKLPITASGVLKTLAYSALKTLLNALYALKGAITGSGLTMSTTRLLGRSTASTGAIEEITLGSGLTLTAGTLSATGDVVGPASSVDSRPALFDGTTGKLLKQGGAALGDAAYASTSTGGNDTADSGKIAQFNGLGGLSVTRALDVKKSGTLPGLVQFQAGDGIYADLQASNGMLSYKTIMLPTTSGTLMIEGQGTAAQATAALGLKSATTTVEVSAAAAPSVGQVLMATDPSAATWQTLSVAGSGDVVGPASSVDSRPALFDGTTGKLLKQGTAALGDAAYKNTGSTAGTLAAGDDARMTNARTPTAHASTHVTGGADAIQAATASQPGLATAAQIAKLDGIETGADVTDAANVAAAGAAMKSVYDSQNLGLITGLQGSGEFIGAAFSGGSGGQLNMAGGNGGEFAAGSAGSINTSGGAGSGVIQAGGSGGNIWTNGGEDGRSGGSINTSGGGGSIDTSNGGGSIATGGTGSIELGNSGTRTTILGTATAARTVSLPDASGTLVLLNGALGTPSSGTLTNCSGLPIAGITASTSSALGVGSLNIGHASDTTLARSSAGNLSIEGNLIYRAGGSFVGMPFEYSAAVSDEATALTAGTNKLTFRIPCAMTVTSVRASVGTAPTGSTLIVDINENGTSILSTKLSIDATEKTSTTAATPAVLSDSALADDAEITIDIDQIGSTIAGAGLKVTLIGTRA